jgi:heme/copper-type cytochrome/quinol oxidase subunit 2
MSPSTRKALVVAALLLVLLPVVLSACPLCKDNLEDQAKMGGGAPNELGRGFYYSILLMVSAPFLVMGVLVLKISRARRLRGARS